MGIFEGRVMLVTGGARGMGRAACLNFGKAGAKVIIADRLLEAGASLAAEMQDSGLQAQFIGVDIADETSVDALYDAIAADYGRLDHALNCAAITLPPVEISETPVSVWDDAFRINTRGTFLCLRRQLAMMKTQRSGSVAVISSGAGLRATRYAATYAATKHAVIGLVTSAALDMAPYGVRVNAICPGVTRTPMIEQWFESMPSAEAELISVIPLGRLAVPEDIAQTASWLLSDAASYITGQSILVDGALLTGVPGNS